MRKILNFGLSGDLNTLQTTHVRLMNMAAMVSVITCILFVAINIIINNKPPVYIGQSVMAVSFLCCLLLNRYKKFSLSRTLYFITLHVSFTIYSFVIDPGQMVEYLHIITIMMLMMFYKFQSKFYMLYLLNIILFYLPQITLGVYPQENFSYVYPTAIFISAFMIVLFFHREQLIQNEILNKNNKRLKKLNEEKNQLLDIAAHDLKSPLQRIEGLLSVIKITSSNLTQEQIDLLNMIENVSRQQNQMIKKVLDISSLEHSINKVNFEQIEIGHVLSQTIMNFEHLAAGKGIHFRVIDLPPTDVFIQGERNSLIQIFENLISNSIKYSPTNTTIRIGVECTNYDVTVSVKDEGPGISKEEQSSLFNKYAVLSSKPTGNESSTGLGLSIAKTYTQAMNGEIWCESELGDGATFYVKFPALSYVAEYA